MQYIDKHLIIDRYVNGSMSPAEMQHFHAMLETDGELRAMFQAENFINSTLNRDRSAFDAVDHSATYSKFLKNLADSIPQTAGTAGTATGGSASWLAGLSSSFKLAVSAAVLTGGLAAGTLWFMGGSAEPAAVPVPHREQPTAQPGTVTPEATQNTPVQTAPVQTAPAPARIERPAADRKATVQSPSAAQRPAAEQPAEVGTQSRQSDNAIDTYDDNTIKVEVQPENRQPK